MQNERGQRRLEAHRSPDLDDGLDDFPRRRARRRTESSYTVDAYRRMEDADELLRQRWQAHGGEQTPADDPVRLLLSHPVISRMAEPWLYVLALGEKVAALGGRLEVNAVFDDDTVTLIHEPGSEGQPPILDRVEGIDPERELPPTEEPDLDDPTALITIPLTDSERFFITGALAEWGGSATPSDEVATLIGFTSKDDLYANKERLILAVRDGQPLTAADWRRVLISAEISFASDIFGVGWEWEAVNQQTDREAVLLLRDIQDKLGAIVHHAKPSGNDEPVPPNDGERFDE